MDWNILRTCLVTLSFLATFSTVQAQDPNFMSYNNVTAFTCVESETTRERIVLSTQCGQIISPCYPDDNYPLNIENGFKLWELNPSSANAIRFNFTINDFDLSANSYLDIASIIRYNAQLDLNTLDRDVRRTLQMSNTMTGDSLSLEATQLYFTFVSIDTTARGFNISYCADLNECGTNPCDANAVCTNTFDSFICTCNVGFNGDGLTCADNDECAPNGGSNCHPNASCANTDGSFTCACNAGFTGDGINCADVDECAAGGGNNCNANAACVNTEGSFTCTCNTGYQGNGVTCTDVDECTQGSPCTNFATCLNNEGSFTCSCNSGFTGDGAVACQDINECDDNSLNNCDMRAMCMNTNGSFECTCNSGYTGDGTSCTDINECTTGTPCDAQASCTNIDGSFTCACNTGYTGNGLMCTNIDECTMDMNNCHGDATCMDTMGAFTCTCDIGFTGNGTFCQDINECSDSSLNNCSSFAACGNTNGGFTCTCNSGFSGNGVNCDDSDECANGGSNCDPNASCANTDGSFTCACNAGFTGDGVNCADVDESAPNGENNCNTNAACVNAEDVDECAAGGGNNCNANAACANTEGSFTCTCNTGYQGNGVTCSDVNECTTQDATLAAQCADFATCLNNEGSFTCNCRSGFTGDGAVACQDINECNDNSLNNCDMQAMCMNTNGSFECTCNSGYTGNGISCTDVDECATGTPCDAQATCTNTDGAFTCACNTGFTGDGLSCSNIDECALNTDNCHGNATCVDNTGSFTCTCNNGFTGSGTFCQDIDECAAGGGNNCNQNAACMNTEGSFTCTCNTGYTGNGVTCTDIDECASSTTNNCTRDGERCNNLPGTFECICDNPDFRGNPTQCRFYCRGFDNETLAICSRNGVLEWPFLHDGILMYETEEAVSWFINLTSTTAIRFTFEALSLGSIRDYVIVSNSSDSRLGSVGELAVFSGPSLNAITNLEDPATETNPSNGVFNPTTLTYTISQAEVYVHFISGRDAVSTGFVLSYEEDVDDCIANAIACQNGGTCQDGVFTYNCANCNAGYTGQNCTTDIDECAMTPNPCDQNAACANTQGSFTCTCNSEFFGNGTTCVPLIQLSNLQVTTQATATTSTLTVNFDILEPWRSNPDYVLNYRITIENQDTGGSRSETTPSVDMADFVPHTLTVMANTNYSVVVTAANFGSLYVSENAQFQYATVNDEAFFIDSAQIAPLAPTDLEVILSNDLLVRLNWTDPDPTNTGVTTEFEVGYRRTNADCNTFFTVETNQVDCDSENLIRITPGNKPYGISRLQQYREYQIRIRAYTSFGAGPWTGIVTTFTGNLCPPSTTSQGAMQSTCTEPRAAIQSPGFPNPPTDFDTQFWQINFNGRGAIQTYVEFFNGGNSQDFLDAGSGPLPDVDPAVDPAPLQNARVVALNGSIDPGQITTLAFDETAANQGLLFFVYLRDRLSTAFGFLVRYETNASRCVPDPCQNAGSCSASDFDFVCSCPSFWTGKICNIPLLTVLQPTCSAQSTSSFLAEWTVTPEWESISSVIPGFEINHRGLQSPATLSRDTRNYTGSGFTPYSEVNVSITIVGGTAEAMYVNNFVVCRTAEDLAEAPAAVTAVGSPTTTSGSTIIAVTVSWTPPDAPNGLILGYYVTYMLQGEAGVTVNAIESDRSIVINNLLPFRSYTFSVAAVNSIGVGAARNTTIVTPEGIPEGPVQTLNVATDARSATVSFAAPALVTGQFTYEASVNPSVGSPVTGDQSPLTVTGLTPATQYTFSVVAITSEGRGPAATQSATTNEDIPGEVGSVSATAMSASSIVVNWAVPAEPNGAITGYRVTWVPSSGGTAMDMSVGSSPTTFTITSLTTFTEYSVTVYASTSIGEGPGVTVAERTSAGVPEGPVQSLNVATDARSATVSFAAPILVTGQFTYEVSVTPSVGSPVTGNQSPLTVTGLTPATQYTFSVVAITSEGRGPAATQSATTNEDIPGEVGSVSATAMSASSIVVNWAVPAEPNGAITGYRVTWVPSSGGTEMDMSVGSSPTTFTIMSLTTFTEYSVTVYASTSIGEGPGVTVAERTSAGAPVGPVQSVSVVPGVTYATVTAADPAVVTGPFTFDYLYYPVGVPAQAAGQNNTSSPFNITGLMPNVDYTVVVYPRSGGERGADAVMMDFTTMYGLPSAVLNLQSGVITATSVECNWNAPAQPMGGVTEYIITWTPATGSGSSSVTGTTATVSNLTPFTTYSFTVLARNPAGDGPAETLSNIRTSASAPVGPVQNVSVVSGSDAITVTVEDPLVVTGPFTFDYIIYPVNMPDQVVARLNDTDSPFTVPGLMGDVEYTVIVYPRSGGERGADEFAVNFTTMFSTPSVVQNLQQGAVTATSVELSWEEPAVTSGGITEYLITWTPGSGSLTVTGTTATISNLTPYTNYTFSVLARNPAGDGAAATLPAIETLEAVPSAVQGLTVSQTSGMESSSFDITFSPPAERNGVLGFYTVSVRVTSSCQVMFNDDTCNRGFILVFPAEASSDAITRTVSGLSAFRTFTISVQVNTSAGEGPEETLTASTAEGVPSGSVTNVVVDSISNTVSWDAPSPVTGSLSYIVNATNLFTGETTSIIVSGTTADLNGLDDSFAYSVVVFPQTSAGIGPAPATPAVELAREPTLVPNVAPMLSTSVDFQNGTQASSINIQNPCNDLARLFQSNTGTITLIEIIVKETAASNETALVTWGQSVIANPALLRPYITGVIDCTVNTNQQGRRKKRQVSPDRSYYTVGADRSCINGVATEQCNGPLPDGRSFHVAIRGRSAAGASEISQYSASTTTSGSQLDQSLQPGVIAAIVISSVVALLLLILLVVFCIRRRRNSDSQTINGKGGKDNPIYAQVSKKSKPQPAIQRFEMEAHTETEHIEQTGQTNE